MAKVDGFDPATIRDRGKPGDQWREVAVRANPRFSAPVVGELPALKPPPSPEEVLLTRALVAAEMLHRQGIVVDADELHAEDPGVPLSIWRELVQTEQFRLACEARGIPPASLTGLTPHMLSALEIYYQLDAGKGHDVRLRAAGITRRIWSSWMRIPAFAAYVNGHGELSLKDSQPVALERIAEAIDDGQKWAIELGLEMTGRHDRRQQQVSTQDILMAVFMALDDAGVPATMLQQIGDSIRRRMGLPDASPVVTIPAVGRGEERAQ